MRASHYAHALLEMLPEHASHEEKLMENFVKTVQANGHAHLLPKILRSFGRIVEKEEKASTIEVTSATALSESETASLLRAEPYRLALSSNHRRVIRKTDKGIVGGTLVRTGTMRIDASYKRMLLDLYKNMTKS